MKNPFKKKLPKGSTPTYTIEVWFKTEYYNPVYDRWHWTVRDDRDWEARSSSPTEREACRSACNAINLRKQQIKNAQKGVIRYTTE